MPKIIGVVGPSHCGGTTIVNMICLIYEMLNIKTEKCTVQDYQLNNYDKNADVLIMKCNDYDYNLDKIYDILLLPIRDFRNSATFWKYLHNPKATDLQMINYILGNISYFKCWEHKSYILRYEDYLYNPINYVNKILYILGVKLEEEEKKEILTLFYNSNTIYNYKQLHYQLYMSIILQKKLLNITVISQILKQFGYYC
jgi:hypothetical protein